MALKITNRDARRLWLHSHGLTRAPTGPLDVLQIIKGLGFVQLDSIRNVTRAHHHILWSRNQNYREPMLWKCLSQDRSVFEHFTHDASVIPMEYYPMWQKQFRRMQKRLEASKYYKTLPDAQDREAIKNRIRSEGSLSTRAFNTKIPDADYKNGKKQMWSRPPHKLALDYMWYVGELTTSHRTNFIKYYNLTEHVIPQKNRARKHDDRAQINWLCTAALERLGTASLRDIQKFWDAVSTAEVKNWAQNNAERLIPISVQAADRSWHDMFAPTDIEDRLAGAKTPTSRLRILNPFDPAIRDRPRLLRLFGFDYRI
ncbi:MAG: winged helix DNA-binding domain-containing protein, partial [Robiginitomaculum sp.]|nr:winged helix DNA-binding domain-containing protein [Robiginitomaculum sp.]